MNAPNRSIRSPRVRAWAHTAAALILAAWTGAAVTITIDNVAGSPGAQAVARVTIDQGMGIAGATFHLVAPEFVTIGTPTTTADTPGFLLASRTGAGRLTVSIARSSGLQSGPAALFTFPIRISREAPRGTFTLACEPVQLCDQATAPVESRTVPGLLTVLPPPADLDGDGLPDQWETNRLGHSESDGSDDPDADGASNYAEFLAGTDPASPRSVFRVVAQPVRHDNGDVAVVLNWQAQPDRNYLVYWSEGPLSPEMDWHPVYHPVYQVSGTRFEWIDDGTRTGRLPPLEGERYYRVQIETP